MIYNGPKRVIVLGGGVAGLSAAWRLAEAGMDVWVLERDAQPGGLCRTIWCGEFAFDVGGHRFFTEDQEVLDAVRDLVGDDLVVTPRKSVIKLLGQEFSYPLDFAELLIRLDPLTLGRAATSYAAATVRRWLNGHGTESFEDWVTLRFGRTLYDIFFGPYTAKLWGMPPSQLSADWAAQRIMAPDLLRLLVQMIKRSGNGSRTVVKEFYYPRGGIGRIPTMMVERLTARGGRLITGATVRAVHVQENRAQGVTYERGGVEQTLSADWIIATLPLPDLAQMVHPVRPRVAEASARLRFRGIRFVNLTLDLEQASENTWIYVPEERYVFFRIQEPRNWNPTLAPDGKTSLSLEVAASPGDPLWTADERELVQRCVQDLAELGLDVRGKVLGHWTLCEPHAYPVYGLGYRAYVERLLEWAERFDNVVACGRQGLFRYNNMDHSIKMGFAAARCVLGQGSLDEIRSIAAGPTYFEVQKPVRRFRPRYPGLAQRTEGQWISRMGVEES